MRAVVQRVKGCSVSVGNACIGRIGPGFLILLGIKKGDTRENACWLADKCAGLRIFEDTHGKFNLSLLDISGEVMVVSQFTLYGDCRRGRRPAFTDAAAPEAAEALYTVFKNRISEKGIHVESGRFGARIRRLGHAPQSRRIGPD